jgi:predicted CoA-binding protein
MADPMGMGMRSQVGIVSEEARQIAEAAGLIVVMNRCMGVTHRLLGLRAIDEVTAL